jgi:hypothetical protein
MTVGEIHSIIWALSRHDRARQDEEERERIFAEVYEWMQEVEASQ